MGAGQFPVWTPDTGTAEAPGEPLRPRPASLCRQALPRAESCAGRAGFINKRWALFLCASYFNFQAPRIPAPADPLPPTALQTTLSSFTFDHFSSKVPGLGVCLYLAFYSRLSSNTPLEHSFAPMIQIR